MNFFIRQLFFPKIKMLWIDMIFWIVFVL
jgi:hypothetical protein